MQAKTYINSTLDEFSKQIDELTIIRNELRTKVQVKQADFKKVKKEVILEKEEVTKLNKQIVASQNQSAKITADSNDIYK